jgi:undecaprenyl-diphosphatase
LLPSATNIQSSWDTHWFRDVNHFARQTSWLHSTMEFFAKYGIVLLAVALVVAWWISRRESSARRVAISVWGAIAALIALAIAQPISSAVNEKRPFVAIPSALTLIHHANDAGFPSDHATGSGAVAAALLFVSWRLGLITWLIALIIAFSRVYVGVHYPQDVLAGLALGAIVALLGLLLVVPIMTRMVEWLGGTPLHPLVRTGGQRAEPEPAQP